MADLSITAANVAASATATIDRQRNAGESFSAGQVVYLKSSDNKYYKADANSGTAEARTPTGIALNTGVAGQPCAVVSADTSLTIGATVTVGAVYVLSATPGGIAPVADLVSGDYVTILGVGVTASTIKLNLVSSGVAIPA